MRKLVVLDDSVIISLIHDPKYMEIIPCFFNKREIFANRNIGCSSCAQKRKEKQRSEMAQIKSCLASMSPEKKNELRKLLDTEQSRVVYINGAGQVTQLTF